MPPETRERLIGCAHDLFYVHGFHQTGLDQILQAAGVTKSTFYNHFSSKDELILEALRWHDRWWQDAFRKMVRDLGGDIPRGQLLAIPRVVETLFDPSSYHGCIFVNASVEFPASSDPIHQLAADHKAAMIDIIRELAGYARADDPPALAQELAMVIEGAYVSEQVSPADTTKNTLDHLVQILVDRRVPA